jgi:hypothetical protein
MSAHRIPLEIRFWAKVDRSGDCWLWTASIRRGYGRIRIDGKDAVAHRVAWELTNGPIPDGLEACHRCDVRNCVNPGHLFLGTSKDNKQDAISKGRHCFGVRHHAAKLTDADVLEARNLRLGGMNWCQLARRFGVTRMALKFALSGRNWRHVA